MKVLLTGASGYVGGRLGPVLVERGHAVRAAFSDPSRGELPGWTSRGEVVAMDALDEGQVRAAVAGVDAVVYLVHGMGGDDFVETDRRAANHMASAARSAGVRRIVYVSGLVPDVPREDLSDHISSRLEVEEILTGSGVPTISLRAAVLLGSASTSFEVIRQISERLPVQVIPTWMDSQVQPIAIVDALAALVGALESEQGSRSYDIGGRESLAYADLLRRFGEVSGATAPQLSVPLLPQALVAKAAAALIEVPTPTVEALMESLRHDMVCTEDDFIADLLPPGHTLVDLDTALARSLGRGEPGDPMGPLPDDPEWAGSLDS